MIIGGVAGGATAAARARRLNERAEIILFERGEHISFANCGLDLRGSLDKLDAETQYVPYCAVGMRGYLAHRILTQNGFHSKNLSGGYRTFAGAKEQIMRESEDEKLWLGE